MQLVLILARLGQYLGAAGLFGGALLFARQPRRDAPRGEHLLLVSSAAALLAFTAVTLALQAAVMAGVTNPIADPSMIVTVLTGTTFGFAVTVRLAATAAAMILLLVFGRRASRRALCALARSP